MSAIDSVDARKRNVARITSACVINVTTCPQCSQLFDTMDRAPRILICGHTLCTECLGHLMHINKQESDGRGTIQCPLDNELTLVQQSDVNRLVINRCCIQTAATTRELSLMRLFICNMAGARVPLLVTADTTIGDAKIDLQQEHPAYLAHLQVWSVACDDDASEAYTVLEDARTVGACALTSGDVVRLVMLDGFHGGAFLRKFGTKGSGDTQLRSPAGVNISPDDTLVCVCDSMNHRVQLLRTADFLHVRTIGGVQGRAPGQLDAPHSACFTRDSQYLFVADEHSVQMFAVTDGTFNGAIDSFGSNAGQFTCPRDVCVSPNGELVLVTDGSANRVQVYRTGDRAYIRTLDLASVCAGLRYPHSACFSPCGERLYVSEHGNNSIQVIRTSDGAQVLTIGTEGSADGQFEDLQHMCTTPSGEWLIVADSGNRRVQVFRASTGKHAHSFGSRGGGDGQFSAPTGVCLSRSGQQLLVTDRGHHRLQVFSYSDV